MRREIFFIMVAFLAAISGCQGNPPPIEYHYTVEVGTDGDTVLYIPVPLEANFTESEVGAHEPRVADIVLNLKIADKGRGVEATHDVVDTRYGKALKISTNGDVILNTSKDYRYLDTHPIDGTQNLGDPIYFNLTMRGGRDGKYWVYVNTTSNTSPTLRYDLFVFKAAYSEYYETKGVGVEGTVPLKEGWQRIRIHRDTFVH